MTALITIELHASGSLSSQLELLSRSVRKDAEEEKGELRSNGWNLNGSGVSPPLDWGLRQTFKSCAEHNRW